MNIKRDDVRNTAQRNSIKERLGILKSIYAPDASLKHLWRQANELHYAITYNTFLNTMDPMKSTLDVYALLALSKLFRTPLETILAEPEDPAFSDFEMQARLRVQNRRKAAVSSPTVLRGYMNSPNRNNEVVTFDLISPKPDQNVLPSLRLKNPDGTEEQFRGRPIMVLDHSIFLHFTLDATGRFIIMGLPDRSNPMNEHYFRKGILLTVEQNYFVPMAQNFILFDGELAIPPSHPMVTGLLKMTDESIPFRISAGKADVLSAEYPEIADFFRMFEGDPQVLEKTDRGEWLVNEGLAQYRARQQADRLSLCRALLLLRNASDLPDRFLYFNDSAYTDSAAARLFGEDGN